MSQAIRAESGSFRDPDSRVFYAAGGVYRALSDRGLEDWRKLAATDFFSRFRADGALPGTELVEDRAAWPEGSSELLRDGWAAVLKHEAIPFVSYPYEWPFGMLKDAAELQLELLLAAVGEGMILKDSSPYNVQWRGSRPVFVDVGSFEPHTEGRPWAGYRQFCMLFLYPLLLRAHKGIPFQPWLRGSIDGIAPGECRRLMSARDLLRPGVFKHVYLHSRLERKHSDERRDVSQELSRAGFRTELIRANAKSLLKLVRGLRSRTDEGVWSEYASINTYDEEAARRKASFVAEAAGSSRWRLLWDLGCNDGHYTRIAAEHADYALAVDADEAVVDGFYDSLKQDGPDSILPLTVNLGDPSPGLGWRGTERKRLEERGRPDLVLCLALVHHVAISGNVPLASFVDWLRELGASLVIEFVTREDPMATVMLGRKGEGANPDYRLDAFEDALSSAFDVERRETICDGKRLLYFAHPRQP